MPRTSVKGQILVDLAAEFVECPTENELKEHHMSEKSVGLVMAQEPLQWEVYVDGQRTKKGQVWG